MAKFFKVIGDLYKGSKEVCKIASDAIVKGSKDFNHLATMIRIGSEIERLNHENKMLGYGNLETDYRKLDENNRRVLQLYSDIFELRSSYCIEYGKKERFKDISNIEQQKVKIKDLEVKYHICIINKYKNDIRINKFASFMVKNSCESIKILLIDENKPKWIKRADEILEEIESCHLDIPLSIKKFDDEIFEVFGTDVRI